MRHTTVAFGGVALGALLLTGMPAAADDRIVLCETFTTPGIPQSDTMRAAVAHAAANFPGRVIILNVQNSGSFATTWGYNRVEYYGWVSSPMTVVDGVTRRFMHDGAATYTSDIQARLNTPTPITMTGTLWMHSPPDRFRLDLTISRNTTPGPAMEMVINIAQALDYCPAEPDNQNCFIDDSWPADTISLSPGGSISLQKYFKLVGYSLSRRDDLRIIAWAQKSAPSWPAPVHQALELRLGLCDPDLNIDGYVDGVDYDLFMNAYENGHWSADHNGDGFVDGIDSDLFNNQFEAGC